MKTRAASTRRARSDGKGKKEEGEGKNTQRSTLNAQRSTATGNLIMQVPLADGIEKKIEEERAADGDD